MKKLVLEKTLKKKLSRLYDGVGELTYAGVDPATLADLPIIAIVGTRKLSPYGTQVTRKIAEDLARAGVVVVSGLAFGADITAHKAVLDAGGKTIAILPSGLENVYPASHARYAERITEKGCLISEYGATHHPWKVEFLERNRIIAALSDAVIIPEAAERSGSLNTAGHALAMGIPVFAVPGPITSSLSAGTNALLKSGEAQLLTEANDVLLALNISARTNTAAQEGGIPEETKILTLITEGCHDPSLLQERSELSTITLQTTITMLEIAGRIKQDSVGNWHLA
jgi:DNA processing protein